MKNLYKHRMGERGFTLLLAALISSIVLAIGTSIFEIADKEVTLSSLGRDSQFAFYAADTASECALYWDVRFNYFATTTPQGVTPVCDSQTLSVSPPSGTYPYTQTFSYSPNGYCANVSVTKAINSQTGGVDTTIRADGFSTSCTTISTSPRALQRSVELHY